MATHDVTTFVQALKDFREHLPPAQQAMLDHIIASAQQSDETAGYGFRAPRTETPEQDDDTAGYGIKGPRSEPEQNDDTAAYGRFAPRSEAAQDDDTAPAQPIDQNNDDHWTKLAAWLSREDDTQGFIRWF